MKRSEIMLCLFIVFMAQSPVALTAATGVAETRSSWPISNLRLIHTQWSSWIQRFFALDAQNNLIYIRIKDGENEQMPVFQYARTPDLTKHFPLDDGDLIITIYNKEKLIHFLAFDFSANVRYTNEFPLQYNVYDVDARVDPQSGSPVCLFHAYDKQHYAIKYWADGKTQDIMMSTEPIEMMLFHWTDSTIHYVSSSESKLSWTAWKNGEYKTIPLPFSIKSARFFQYRNVTFLVGLDLQSGLWAFDLTQGKLRKTLLAQSAKIAFSDSVIALMHNKQLNLVMTSKRTSRAHRLVYDDFPHPRKKPELEERSLFWHGNLYPIIDSHNHLNFLLETNIQHIFLESWSAPTTIISDIDWRLDVKRNPPMMIINWATPKGAQYAYRYVFNKEPNSEPLSEEKLIKSNSLQFSAREDGTYVLHLQIRNLRTGSYSRVYHIPIVWRYTPFEPDIELQNTVSPRMIQGSRATFLIRNFQAGQYYAEISTKKDTVPKKIMNSTSGRFDFTLARNPGRYYLHIAHRDPRSLILSPVAHYLFFVSPFDIEKDPEMAENNRRIEEIKRIERKIEEAQGDPAEIHRWVNHLRTLQPTPR